ncbi:hypothetical protein SLS53_007286 [Cytospora paraplurivora]|uniref:Uncharacterized protein n=1 Tax=Cytospora paraplurivora TaxID=2898453 RepID=A0AAN9U3F0_9PEZI
MASFFDLTRPHLAYYSVPAAFLLALAPHAYASIAAGKSYDLAYPRKTVESAAKDTSQDKQTVLRVQRAEAASANAFETLSYLSLGYLASRAVYNVIYVFLQDNRKIAPLRSLTWNVSTFIIITAWVKAGNRAAAALS